MGSFSRSHQLPAPILTSVSRSDCPHSTAGQPQEENLALRLTLTKENSHTGTGFAEKPSELWHRHTTACTNQSHTYRPDAPLVISTVRVPASGNVGPPFSLLPNPSFLPSFQPHFCSFLTPDPPITSLRPRSCLLTHVFPWQVPP